MNRNIVLIVGLLAVCILFSGCRSTKDKKISNPIPTKFPAVVSPWPNDDDEVLDSVSFFRAIDTSLYDKITVLSSDFSKMVVDEKDANDKSPIDSDKISNAKVFEKWFDPIFVENLKSEESGLSIPLLVGNNPTSGISLKATILTADTGSAMARTFGGFGAGKVKFKVQVDLIDAKTQEILVSVRFSKSDWGGSMSSGGGRLLSKTVLDNYYSFNQPTLMLIQAEDKFAKENLPFLLKTLFPKTKK